MSQTSATPPKANSLANRLRAWGPAAAWAAVLFLLSATPGGLAAARSLPISDEVLHLCVYSVLGAALGNVRIQSSPAIPHGVLIALGVLYGATDEWHQSMVPGRVPSVTDWLADAAGVVIGYGVWLLFKTYRVAREAPATKGTTT